MFSYYALSQLRLLRSSVIKWSQKKIDEKQFSEIETIKIRRYPSQNSLLTL